MNKTETDSRPILENGGNRRPAIRYFSGIAPGIIRASLYLGLTYLALFVGVETCHGAVCGPGMGDYYVYGVSCADGTIETCGTHDPGCSPCTMYVYCGGGHGAVTGRSCDCSYVPPADSLSVSGSVSCAASGSGGWCRGSATLNISATDSAGHTVTISPCGSNPCSVDLPEGQGDYSFSADCSGGLHSDGSAHWQLDRTPPDLNSWLTGGTPGAGGWYLGGPVTLNCSGTDTLSGFGSISYDTQTANGDGSHTLSCSGSDLAGNTATATETVNIDGTPPVLSHSVSGGVLGAGVGTAPDP